MVTNVTTNSDSTVVHWAIRPIELPPGDDVGVDVLPMVVDGLMTLSLDVGVVMGRDLGVPITQIW